MGRGLMIGEVVTKIGATRAPVNEELATTGAILNPIKAHDSGFRFVFWMAPLAKPAVVGLYTLSRVGGRACTSSASVVQMRMASWPLRKVAPILASAAEAMTLEIIL